MLLHLSFVSAPAYINGLKCRAIMTLCGDTDDCISTTEAAELAAKLEEREINNLPRPGHVDFINGGPPCQVNGHLSYCFFDQCY